MQVSLESMVYRDYFLVLADEHTSNSLQLAQARERNGQGYTTVLICMLCFLINLTYQFHYYRETGGESRLIQSNSRNCHRNYFKQKSPRPVELHQQCLEQQQ